MDASRRARLCPDGPAFASAGTSPALHAAYDELLGRAAIDFAPPYARSNIAPGHYTLDVMRVGFSRVSERVQVGPDSAVEAVAVLSPHHLMLDGCGYVLVRERKPWWKWW